MRLADNGLDLAAACLLRRLHAGEENRLGFRRSKLVLIRALPWSYVWRDGGSNLPQLLQQKCSRWVRAACNGNQDTRSSVANSTVSRVGQETR